LQRGRPLLFDAHVYRQRNVFERCIKKLKQWRSIATGYERQATNYRARVVLASIVLWLIS
jgi:transposase